MESTNLYSSPGSRLETGSVEPYQPQIFAVNGRIGRVRYLAYGLINSLISVLVVAFSAGLLAAKGNVLFVAIGGIAYLVMIVYSIILMKRRLNDLDKSGWLGLLMIVPLVNFVMALYLLFGSGTAGQNRFGPPPTKNNISTILAAILAPVLAVSLMAGVAIPQYQAYIQRVQQHAQTVPQP